MMLSILQSPILRKASLPFLKQDGRKTPWVRCGTKKTLAFAVSTLTQRDLTHLTLCIETTPGVYTASGYGDIAVNKSVWFWFFEARKNPSSAPLAIWLNGGVCLSYRLTSMFIILIIMLAGQLKYDRPLPRTRSLSG
jgi:hypothetical protein